MSKAEGRPTEAKFIVNFFDSFVYNRFASLPLDFKVDYIEVLAGKFTVTMKVVLANIMIHKKTIK